MANISSTIKSALATLNDVRLMTSNGLYNGPLLGDLIGQAMSADPLEVWTGTADPTVAPGVVGSKAGDLYLRDAPGAGGGQLWINIGDTATSWTLVNTVAGTNLTSAHIFVGSAGNIATDVGMTGEASILNTGAVTLSNAAVIGKVITGFASGAAALGAGDTLLQAINKLDGNVGTKLPSADFSDANVTAKVLGAGYLAAPGVVTIGDTIEAAFEKLDGNVSAAGGIYKTMSVISNGMSDLEFNLGGLATAIAQAVEMRTVMVTHFSSIAAHAIADPYSWAQVNVVATVGGTAGGLITVLGAPTLDVDNLIYVGNNPPLAVQPATGYVASRDVTTTPGSTIYHITVGAGGAGGDVDLTAYTVALGACIFRSINVLPANPTTLATLLTFVNVLRQGFALHDTDADLGAAWQYHFADEVGPHLPNLALPLTTLVEAIAVLTDLHAVYDAHIAENATHNASVDIGPTTLPDASYGAAIWITDAIVAAGDRVAWSILDGGAGAVKGVSAVAAAGGITFTFSANPAGDTVFGYTVHRVV